MKKSILNNLVILSFAFSALILIGKNVVAQDNVPTKPDLEDDTKAECTSLNKTEAIRWNENGGKLWYSCNCGFSATGTDLMACK